MSTLCPEAKELHRSSLTSYETYLKVFVFLTVEHVLMNSVSPAVKCIQIEEMSVRYGENIGFLRELEEKKIYLFCFLFNSCNLTYLCTAPR